MIDEPPTTPLVIRLATPDDISLINVLDSYSDSPTRDIHREMEKYFGSVDPSTHEKTVIFLAEVEGVGAAKAELMLPPADAVKAVGYIKRIVVDPQYRKRGLARHLCCILLPLPVQNCISKLLICTSGKITSMPFASTKRSALNFSIANSITVCRSDALQLGSIDGRLLCFVTHL